LGTLDDCTTYRVSDNISAIAHSCIREEGYERGNRKEEARFDDNPDNFLQIAPVLLIGPNTVNMMHLVPVLHTPDAPHKKASKMKSVPSYVGIAQKATPVVTILRTMVTAQKANSKGRS